MKAILLIGLGIFSRIGLAAQTDGPFNPTEFANANLSGYSQQWVNISNAGYSDEIYATFGNLSGPAGTHTDYLVATNFGFNIPPGTSIVSIMVEVECSDPNSRTSDYSVRIVKNGSIGAAERAVGKQYPATDKYMIYGGNSDLWGETWDYKYIDDSRFGVAIAAQRDANDAVITAGKVNNIRITVNYTYITLPVTVTSFTATKESKTVRLNWNTVSENSIDHYELQRSADGRNFQPLANVPARNEPVTSYNFIDNNPIGGIGYYRLKIEGLAGYQKYSKIVAVSFTSDYSVVLYPSPWQKGTELGITNNRNEKLIIYFFDAGGQLLSTATTQSRSVPAETLNNRKGLLYYKIYDLKKTLLGSGSMLIL